MKQVVGATVGFFTGGPVGALAGLAGGHAWDQADKGAKAQKASSARVELNQRRAQSQADNERKRLLQEASGLGGPSMLRRRGPLTSYAGAA